MVVESPPCACSSNAHRISMSSEPSSTLHSNPVMVAPSGISTGAQAFVKVAPPKNKEFESTRASPAAGKMNEGGPTTVIFVVEPAPIKVMSPFDRISKIDGLEVLVAETVDTRVKPSRAEMVMKNNTTLIPLLNAHSIMSKILFQYTWIL